MEEVEPQMVPMAAALLGPWRWLYAPVRDVVVGIHPCGLHFEVSEDAFREVRASEATTIAAALNDAIRGGVTGIVAVESRRWADGTHTASVRSVYRP